MSERESLSKLKKNSTLINLKNEINGKIKELLQDESAAKL
jgi:hypothetical protein